MPISMWFKTGRGRTATAVASLALLFTSALPAQPLVPPAAQAAVFFRVLSYDRALASRAGADVVLAIVYKKADGESEKFKMSMAAAFKELAAKKLQGLPLTVVEHSFTDGKELTQWLGSSSVDILYVAPGLESDTKNIRGAAGKVVLLTSRRESVVEGVALGVVLKENKPAILVNLTTAKAIGMDLDPKVLQLSEVVR